MRRFSNVRALREARGLSTGELAARLGVCQSSVVRLEQSEKKRTITLASLERVAEALGCTVQYELVSTNKRFESSKPSQIHDASTLDKRARSKVSRALKSEEEKKRRVFSAVDRINQACQLSDFVFELGLCSKRP